MANITAENTAAFIEYDGDWNGDSEYVRRATVSNSSLTLNFTGTALWAFGEFEGNVDCQLDGRICPATTFQPSNAPDQSFLTLQNLAYGPHVLCFRYTSGTFGVSRLIWYNPNSSTNRGPEMNPLSTDSGIYVGGSWYERLHEVDTVQWMFRETRNASAYMTFIFQGTGIEVEGLTAPDGDTFSATLDERDPVNRTSQSPHRHPRSILHREDGLEYKTHNLTLTKRGDTGCIAISNAQVFIPQPTTPNTSLSLGTKAGIAVGVLSIFGLFTLAVLYIRHRRAHMA